MGSVCATEQQATTEKPKPKDNMKQFARDNALFMLDTGATDCVAGTSWHMRALNLVGERRQVPIYIPSKRGFSFGGNPGVVCNGKFVYPVAVGSLTGEAAVHILEDGKQVCPGPVSYTHLTLPTT